MKSPNKPPLAVLAGYLPSARRFVPVLLTMLAGATLCRAADADAKVKFDVNDVSFLWPVPTNETQVGQLISMGSPPDGSAPIWPTALFKDVVAKAKATKIKVEGGGDGVGISFPPELEDPGNWKVVGIRVNPASLGSEMKFVPPEKQPGQVPGIRLVVQPVTMSGGKVKVHDFAAHIAFNFIKTDKPFDATTYKPDNEFFEPVVNDLKDLKQMVEKVRTTAGKLGVHPGFTAPEVPGFRDRLRKMLKDRLRPDRLQVISFMGIPAPNHQEPWIFFSVAQLPGRIIFRSIGSFPAPADPLNPTDKAQMISRLGGPIIVPAPTADPANTGDGLSMALLLADDLGDRLGKPLFNGTSPAPFNEMKLQDLADLMGNPKFRNTLNTDCISCHTDTTRKNALGITGSSKVAFDISALAGISPADDKLLPKGGRRESPSWNIRNFGWFPISESETQVTVSRRAANEAAESADFINKHYLNDQ